MTYKIRQSVDKTYEAECNECGFSMKIQEYSADKARNKAEIIHNRNRACQGQIVVKKAKTNNH